MHGYKPKHVCVGAVGVKWKLWPPFPQGDLVVTDRFRAAWHLSWIYSNQSLYALARDPSEMGMPHTLTWLLWQAFSYKASVDRQTLGAEYIKRSQWHTERPVNVLHHTAHGVRDLDVSQVTVEDISLMRDWQTSFPNSTHVFVSLRKTNYALFPLIKPLISADGFRNMKQNSE